MSEPYRKKLIEVALPLEAINRESAHEKSVPRRGHPATMHVWWARRPLAACRAVIFASIVDDPSSHPERFPTEELQQQERLRLFRVLEELVSWENSSNEAVLGAARREMQGADEALPTLIDPFCGGGAIPLEGHRLNLRIESSDLNPIPTLITKALVEIPPRFSGQPPVNGDDRGRLSSDAGWMRATGLAADVRHYGRRLRDEAERAVGHLYPQPATEGGTRTPLAWIWARTVSCPNPACGITLPLAASFVLSSKRGRRTWVEPEMPPGSQTATFKVCTGDGSPPDATVSRRGARCIACSASVPFDHIRREASEGRMGTQLMATVVEGNRQRIFLRPSAQQEEAARAAVPSWEPESELPVRALGFRVQRYGITRHSQLFTRRQLSALGSFSGLLADIGDEVVRDAVSAGLVDDGIALVDGGRGARAYAEAVTTYIAFAVDKLADWNSSLCSWIHSIEGIRPSFPRSAMSMVWDFAETNPFSNSVGNFMNHIDWVRASVEAAPSNPADARARQLDVRALAGLDEQGIVITDPPYYDNVGYAALSDFFYVWLRRSIGEQYPDLFSTLLTPKDSELIAEPARHSDDAAAAKSFFEAGLRQAFEAMRDVADDAFPVCMFYAFKQAEATDGPSGVSVASTGWETMLEGLIGAGFAITGTWPMRTERAARPRQHLSNALASSIVLVCRPRPAEAALATRRDFIGALKAELPNALRTLQVGNVAPVDLAQASIGPGMAVFSRYAKVLEADGSQVTVRAALGLINHVLDEILDRAGG